MISAEIAVPSTPKRHMTPTERRDLALASLPSPGYNRWLLTITQSPETRDAYVRDISMWHGFAERNRIDLMHPTPSDGGSFHAERLAAGDSDATADRRLATVLSFYAWARHEGLTTAEPKPFKFKWAKARRQNSDVAATETGLDLAQLAAVRKHAGSPRNLALVDLLSRCGLRVSEALGADRSDIADKRGHRALSVTGKGAKQRTVPIPPGAWHSLDAYVGARTGPLFITRTGARWQRDGAYDAIVGIGKRAGVPDLHPHTLRHTAATLMLDAGEDVDKVRVVMGHSSLDTTMGYVRAREGLDLSPVYGLDRYLAKNLGDDAV